MLRRRTTSLLALAVTLTLGAAVSAAGRTYTFAVIAPPPGAYGLVATAINNAGQVVGYYLDENNWHSFLKDGESFTTIEVPGSTITDLNGINSDGLMVGSFADLDGAVHGVVTDGSTFTVFDVPNADATYPKGINDLGHVVGWFVEAGGTGNRGFLKIGDTFTLIDVPGATNGTFPWGINDAGQIVGYFSDWVGLHGFLKDGDSVTVIDVSLGNTLAFGINALGQIVGSDGEQHGFLKDGDNVTLVTVPSAWLTTAWGINDLGQIAGGFANDFGSYGFVATPTTIVYLHGSGATANPPTLTLDDSAPSATTAKFKDSAGISFAFGNPWKEVGSWLMAPASSTFTITGLDNLDVFLGLKNSDDQGTQFDVRADVFNNGVLVGSTTTACITGVTRNPSLAKEIILSFDPITSAPVVPGDVLSLTLSTRIGTNPNGSKCTGPGGSHNNAVGLRAYFDAVSRPARFEITTSP